MYCAIHRLLLEFIIIVLTCEVARHVARDASDPSLGRSCLDVRSNISSTDDDDDEDEDDDDDEVDLDLVENRRDGHRVSAEERLDREGLATGRNADWVCSDWGPHVR